MVGRVCTCQPMRLDIRQHETSHFLRNSETWRCLCLRKGRVAVVWKVDWARMGGCCPTKPFRTQGLRWGQEKEMHAWWDIGLDSKKKKDALVRTLRSGSWQERWWRWQGLGEIDPKRLRLVKVTWMGTVCVGGTELWYENWSEAGKETERIRGRIWSPCLWT